MSARELTHEDRALLGKFLTNAIRSAVLRAKPDASELQSIGLALSNGSIDADSAIARLVQIGLVDELLEPPADTGRAA